MVTQSTSGSKKLDLLGILAIVWIIIAVAITIFMAPRLGLRGWVWLIVHDLLCLVGSVHQLSRTGYK